MEQEQIVSQNQMNNTNELNNLIQIDNQINELKDKRRNVQNRMKIKKMHEDKKLRVKSNSNGKSNVLKRVSSSFANKLDFINDKREENGFDKLSNPKITELIIKHISSWKPIEQDIINFNTELDTEEKQEEFADEK